MSPRKDTGVFSFRESTEDASDLRFPSRCGRRRLVKGRTVLAIVPQWVGLKHTRQSVRNRFPPTHRAEKQRLTYLVPTIAFGFETETVFGSVLKAADDNFLVFLPCDWTNFRLLSKIEVALDGFRKLGTMLAVFRSGTFLLPCCAGASVIA